MRTAIYLREGGFCTTNLNMAGCCPLLPPVAVRVHQRRGQWVYVSITEFPPIMGRNVCGVGRRCLKSQLGCQRWSRRHNTSDGDRLTGLNKPDSLRHNNVNHCARLETVLCQVFQAGASWGISSRFLDTNPGDVFRTTTQTIEVS